MLRSFCKFQPVNFEASVYESSSLGPAPARPYTRGVKIALGQINPTIGDFSGNAAKIVDFSRRAQSAGAGMILFPELSVCGYPPRDLVERPSFVARNRETTEQIAAQTQRDRRDLRTGYPCRFRRRQVGHEFRRFADGRQDRLHPVKDVAADLRRFRRDAELCSRQEAGIVSVLRAIAWR